MSLVRSSSLNICLTIFETFTHVLDLDPSTMSSNCLEHCLFMIVCSFAWVCILRSSWGSTYMPTFLCGLTVLSPKSKKTHHVKFFLIGWLFPVSWIFPDNIFDSIFNNAAVLIVHWFLKLLLYTTSAVFSFFTTPFTLYEVTELISAVKKESILQFFCTIYATQNWQNVFWLLKNGWQ
jgi:hypothetical protein